jgi:hypothetical protein
MKAMPGKVGTGFPSGIAPEKAMPGKVGTGFPSGIAPEKAMPGKACPGRDPGWVPIFRQALRQSSERVRGGP